MDTNSISDFDLDLLLQSGGAGGETVEPECVATSHSERDTSGSSDDSSSSSSGSSSSNISSTVHQDEHVEHDPYDTCNDRNHSVPYDFSSLVVVDNACDGGFDVASDASTSRIVIPPTITTQNATGVESEWIFPDIDKAAALQLVANVFKEIEDVVHPGSPLDVRRSTDDCVFSYVRAGLYVCPQLEKNTVRVHRGEPSASQVGQFIKMGCGERGQCAQDLRKLKIPEYTHTCARAALNRKRARREDVVGAIHDEGMAVSSAATVFGHGSMWKRLYGHGFRQCIQQHSVGVEGDVSVVDDIDGNCGYAHDALCSLYGLRAGSKILVGGSMSFVLESEAQRLAYQHAAHSGMRWQAFDCGAMPVQEHGRVWVCNANPDVCSRISANSGYVDLDAKWRECNVGTYGLAIQAFVNEPTQGQVPNVVIRGCLDSLVTPIMPGGGSAAVATVAAAAQRDWTSIHGNRDVCKWFESYVRLEKRTVTEDAVHTVVVRVQRGVLYALCTHMCADGAAHIRRMCRVNVDGSGAWTIKFADGALPRVGFVYAHVLCDTDRRGRILCAKGPLVLRHRIAHEDIIPLACAGVSPHIRRAEDCIPAVVGDLRWTSYGIRMYTPYWDAVVRHAHVAPLYECNDTLGEQHNTRSRSVYARLAVKMLSCAQWVRNRLKQRTFCVRHELYQIIHQYASVQESSHSVSDEYTHKLLPAVTRALRKALSTPLRKDALDRWHYDTVSLVKTLFELVYEV